VGHELKLRLAPYHKVVISVVTFCVDVCSDVCFYYALHFMANHWPKALKYKPQDDERTKVPFFKDATLVQFQRMILSPLLYTLWIGTQQVLMQGFDVPSVWATAIGCFFAVAVVRTVHTVWMVKAAKKALAHGGKLLHGLAPKVWSDSQPTGGDAPPQQRPTSPAADHAHDAGNGKTKSPESATASRRGHVSP
jgi:hypothetical protein